MLTSTCALLSLQHACSETCVDDLCICMWTYYEGGPLQKHKRYKPAGCCKTQVEGEVAVFVANNMPQTQIASSLNIVKCALREMWPREPPPAPLQAVAHLHPPPPRPQCSRCTHER